MVEHKKYDLYGFRIKPKKNRSISVDNVNKKKTFTLIGLILFFIFILVILFTSLISSYIAWYCYANDLYQIRIVKTILAFIFSYLYIPYFILMRIILKKPCL